MGIPGLLQALKEVTRPCHVGEWRGQTAAVDAYVWLHRASYGCAESLVRGDPGCAAPLVRYVMSRVEMLRGAGVEPLLVFDGAPLPAKAGTEAARARSRESARERAEGYAREGNRAAAFECFQRAVDITPSHARAVQVALECATPRVAYVVAPFEADAQIGYLMRKGAAGLAITEDSDLLAHGCHTCFFKMDAQGHGEAVRAADVRKVTRAVDLSQFDAAMFLDLCVVAGCDYVPGIPGVALKKAAGLVRRFRRAEGVVRQLRFAGAAVPRHYEDLVVRARLTFLHQRVWCPEREARVHATEWADGEGGGDTDFLGPVAAEGADPEVEKQQARGERCPVTGVPFDPGAIKALSEAPGRHSGGGWGGGPAGRVPTHPHPGRRSPGVGGTPRAAAREKTVQTNTLLHMWAHDPGGVLTTAPARAAFKPPAQASASVSASASASSSSRLAGGSNPFEAFRVGPAPVDDAGALVEGGGGGARGGKLAHRRQTDRKRLPGRSPSPSRPAEGAAASPQRKQVRTSKFFSGTATTTTTTLPEGHGVRDERPSASTAAASVLLGGGRLGASDEDDEDEVEVDDDETPSKKVAPQMSPGMSLHPASVLQEGGLSPESLHCAPLSPTSPLKSDPFAMFAYQEG